MRRFSFRFAALLAFAFPCAVFAATTEKPKSEPASSTATPTPKKRKSASREGDSTPRPTTTRAKSVTSATPEPTPKTSTDAAKEDGGAEATSAKSPASPRKPAQVAAEESTAPASTRAPAATLEPNDLREFATQPPRVQQLITAALELTKLNLTYIYGSADPARGGMDCSGTMYHLLRANGFTEVPRDSSSQYSWARKRGPFFAVVGKSAETFEFDDVLPGDLLFWTGTYETQREIPISHVMLYLGVEKKTNKRVMFGASDGRTYGGIQRWGVSVFDFKMPRENGVNGSGSRVDFVGYARIPDLRDAGPKRAADVAETSVPAEKAPREPAPAESKQPAATPKPSTSKSAASPRPKKPAEKSRTTKRNDS